MIALFILAVLMGVFAYYRGKIHAKKELEIEVANVRFAMDAVLDYTQTRGIPASGCCHDLDEALYNECDDCVGFYEPCGQRSKNAALYSSLQ